MRKLICILITAILLAGCTAYAEEKTITYQTNASFPKVSIRDNPAIEGESPLTGLPDQGETYTPIMLPLDNSPEAHPLWGIGDASILFQIPLTESGGTRLLALFGDSYPQQAGGVRSGRMTMLPLARAFHAAFAYAGVPPIGTECVSVENWLTEWSFRKPTRHYNLLGEHFRERVSFVDQPGNLSAHVKELHNHLSARKIDFEVKPFLFTDDPLNRGDEASKVFVNFQYHDNPSKTNPNSACMFEWKPGIGYIRTAVDGELTDRNTGEAVPFANVIIMKIPVEWERGYPYYASQMRGRGQASIFQSGRYIQGTWLHDNYEDRLVFLDENGRELTFQRGKSFIVLGDDIIVSYINE